MKRNQDQERRKRKNDIRNIEGNYKLCKSFIVSEIKIIIFVLLISYYFFFLLLLFFFIINNV